MNKLVKSLKEAVVLSGLKDGTCGRKRIKFKEAQREITFIYSVHALDFLRSL